MEPHGLFSWLFLNSSHLLPFLLSIPLFLPSLTGGASRSVRLSLIRSGLALQQPRCAIRGTWGRWLIPPLVVLGVIAVGALLIARLAPRLHLKAPGRRFLVPALTAGVLVLMLAPTV